MFKETNEKYRMYAQQMGSPYSATANIFDSKSLLHRRNESSLNSLGQTPAGTSTGWEQSSLKLPQLAGQKQSEVSSNSFLSSNRMLFKSTSMSKLKKDSLERSLSQPLECFIHPSHCPASDPMNLAESLHLNPSVKDQRSIFYNTLRTSWKWSKIQNKNQRYPNIC